MPNPIENKITKIKLSNGLLVLLKEIHTSPLISHWVWYRVGSRNEVAGNTGISHWVEHMQFKGTKAYPNGVLDKAIARMGGFWNAMTSLDWTTYYETLPADQIDLALELEADRLVHCEYTGEDVESERTVIISERQGSENSPFFRLSEEVQAAAFRVHAYHHEVIGDMADLETISRDQLQRHYRRHYVPNNAVIAMAGDFHNDTMLARIKELFEAIPAGELPAQKVRPEPEQRGERRVVVEGPGETPFLQVAYRAPEAVHPDFHALAVLSSLLTGASSLNVFGEGLSNQTSRLYQKLVEEKYAVGLVGSLQATIDPFLYSVSLIPRPDRSPEEVVGILDDEIDRIQQDLPDPAELSRALKQARALFAYGSESITNQAYWLGFTEMFASYEWFTDHLEKLEAVTPEDVQRVAQTYLTPRNRVLGEYIPESGKNGGV